MRTQNSTCGLLRSSQTLIAGVLCALAFLGATGLAHAQNADASSSDDWLSALFSTYGFTIILVLFLVGLMVYKIRASKKTRDAAAAKTRARGQRSEKNYLAPVGTPAEPGLLEDRRAHSRPAEPQLDKAPVVDFEQSAYGAYRIDQEVGKLVLGKPHRMDVMASRVPDDRRAIEASLVKALDSSDAGEDGQRRARQALEEYGFVARQSAMLLQGRDAWERSSAARSLGQIGAQSSLVFLIEALHDMDSVVRNQAVSSLGSLKQPAAIGALLDIARRHTDIPASLLSETLSACSVESLGYLDMPSSEPALLGDGASSAESHEMESFIDLEDLPAGNEDEALTTMLTQLGSSDEKARARAVQELGLHHVQRSVSALSSMALNDSDSAVRAAAVASLGSIDHESVFAPVVIALADESREVRAAAARTLSGLHFDRADAYVRVMETADVETLQTVARACVKTGIAAQAADRLASEDRRQAYEAFSLFSLLAKAHETQPILDVIENHEDSEARLCAVRVLNVAAQPDVAPKLRELVGKESVPDNLRTAILEVLYKLDQEPVFD
ncbi:MAG TPA: HEAT repeat domain-containing protein [Pyrinomonadaceae bacterium]|nr:HEAT repeat domain-containing protein [Pyrinomonadaceae bacterium]